MLMHYLLIAMMTPGQELGIFEVQQHLCLWSAR
jgi:hypothetical protein